MKSRFIVILTVLFLYGIILVTPVFAMSYVCMEASLCGKKGGTQVDNSNCGGGCSHGTVCCEISGFKNWSQIIWGENETPEEFKIMGVEFQTEDLKRIVKTFLIVTISILVAGLGFVAAYGGIVWVTAGDREEQLQKAKKIMKNGFLGVGIAFGFLAVLGVIAGILGVNIWDFSFLETLL